MVKYVDLKAYLQKNYAELLYKAVKEYIRLKYIPRLDTPYTYLIENLEVGGLQCYVDEEPTVNMEVGVCIGMPTVVRKTGQRVQERDHQWFMVHLRGELTEDGLKDVKVIKVKDYEKGYKKRKNTCSEFMVPYININELEDIADKISKTFRDDPSINYQYKLPYKDIFKKYGIQVYYAPLSEDCFGRMYFHSTVAAVYNNKSEICKMIVPRGTLLINRDTYFVGRFGSKRLTLAHEIAHWFIHQMYYKLVRLLDGSTAMLSCEKYSYINKYGIHETEAEKAHWFAEWQANALAVRIAMPRDLFLEVYKKEYETLKGIHGADLTETVFKRMAVIFDVPMFAVKQRAQQLGIDTADGALVYVNKNWHESFSFPEHTLEPHQTFVIDRDTHQQLCEKDSRYAELINSGKYMYIDYVTCVNDSKYLTRDLSPYRMGLKLSDYAREHADECCLKFKSSCRILHPKLYSLYESDYFNSDVDAGRYLESKYDPDFNDKDTQSDKDITAQVELFSDSMKEKKRIFREMMDNHYYSFGQKLVYHMNRLGITVEELAERSGLSERTIISYRTGYVTQPPLPSVMAILIGLNLSKEYCEDMLQSACYHLNDNYECSAYKFLLDYTDGTLEQWNRILDAFGLPPLPSGPSRMTS